MKKTKILWVCALFAVVSLFAAVGCAKNRKPFDGSIPEAVLCDFEQWAPDFQTLRVRNEFGSVDVNTTADYVKSGKQSAALTVVGSDQNMMPYFFVNTTSELFDYDYSDFSKIDSVRAWFYNPSQTEEKLYAGLITEIVSVEQDNLQKFDTFTLSSGWNEIVYRPDMNYIISAVGQSKYDGIKGVYFMFDNPHASNKAEGKRFYVDDITLKYGAEKPYTPVRAGSYYTTGVQIGAPSWIILENPVKMTALENKALHFEFKFDSDVGRFGFAICCDDYRWSNITGTLVIEKQAGGAIVANMGKIKALEDGWYAWELNRDMFRGDGASTAEDVSLIYHQEETVQGNVMIDWESLAAVELQTYFSSNNKIDWSFSSGNGFVSQIPSENGTHNALKITNDNTHSQAQWQYFVLQLDPATIAKLDNAKELALKLKVQRNTAANNVTFNFRISPAKLDNDKWVPDDKNWAKNATESGVDGYSDNVALDTWHTIRFLRKTCWGSDTIAALKANGGKILIFMELKNNNMNAHFASGTDFGFNLIIDDMTVTEYKYILDFENASDADLLQTRSYNSGRVSTCELSTEQKVSGEKSVKVYQNQYGALVVKIPDAMIAAMDGNAKLSVRFNLTQVTKEGALVPEPNPVPIVAFYACSTPDPDTDKADGTWRDCRISGNDWQANVSQNTWYTKQLSDELTAKIKTNGYLWIEVEMQNWQCYTFYVDFITLE